MNINKSNNLEFKKHYITILLVITLHNVTLLHGNILIDIVL